MGLSSSLGSRGVSARPHIEVVRPFRFVWALRSSSLERSVLVTVTDAVGNESSTTLVESRVAQEPCGNSFCGRRRRASSQSEVSLPDADVDAVREAGSWASTLNALP